jgi:hypothetical protein
MNAITPTLGDLLDVAATHAISLTHGPIPAKVLSYNPGTREASVQPVIGVADEEGVVQPATVRTVPVAWGAVSWPLLSGSWVMLVPQDSDVSGWLTSGSTNQAAPTPRTCHESDCIALPWCAWPAPTAAPTVDFVALAAKVLTELQAIKTYVDKHIHAYVCGQSGPLVTTPPATSAGPPPVLDPMPAPGSVASTRVSAE